MRFLLAVELALCPWPGLVIAALSSLVAAGCSLPFAGVNSRYYRAKAYCDVGRKRHGRRLPGAATILLCCIPRPAVMPMSYRRSTILS